MGESKLEFLNEVIAGGRITIPKAVREFLDIEEGDLVKVQIVEVIKAKKR